MCKLQAVPRDAEAGVRFTLKIVPHEKLLVACVLRNAAGFRRHRFMFFNRYTSVRPYLLCSRLLGMSSEYNIIYSRQREVAPHPAFFLALMTRMIPALVGGVVHS